MLPMHTDGCIECLTVETTFILPTRIVEANGVQTTYAYKCPECGHAWQTDWVNNQPDLPEGHPKIRESGR